MQFTRSVLAAGAVCVLLAPPALALPVFSTATLSPADISPNGDEVRDFTVVSYVIAVDSADVRVLLTQAGGAVVDTLQFLTRQGAGTHSLLYDGTTRLGATPDGAYTIRILGVGTQGEGTETPALALNIDRVPPDIVSWNLVSPTNPVLTDGTTVVLQGCFGVIPDTVRLDLSAIDSGFDAGNVVTTSLPPDCQRYSYAVTAGNTRPDAAGLPAVIIAIDRAGNSSTRSLDLCLSNSPPQVTSVSLLNASPYLQNGDEIQARIDFAAPGGLTVQADFSNLDTAFDPGAVSITDLGSQRYEVRYRISDANTRPDRSYRLRLRGEDAGCGVARDSSLTIILDNAGVNSSLLSNVSIDPPAFSPGNGGTQQTTIRFSVIEDTVRVSVSARNAKLINPTETATLPIRTPQDLLRGDYTVVWDGDGGLPSRPPTRLADQNLEIVIRAISLAQDRERNIVVPLEVDNKPPELRDFPPPDSLALQNGKVGSIALTYDRPGYTIQADLSRIDSNFNPASVAISDLGGGAYTLFYSVSTTNTFQDSVNLPIFLTATDLAGNVAGPVDLVRACLNNFPPRLVSARLLGDPGPFGNGDRIVVETTWDSEPHQTPLVVTGDFSAVDDRFDPAAKPPTVIDRQNGVYEISYSISAGNGIEQGTQLPIRVTARDDPAKGCGVTTVDAVLVDLDTRAGPQPTLVATSLVVRGTTVTLSGDAPEAVLVQIQRNGTVIDTLDVGLDSRYSGSVNLLSGSNVFVARSLDAADNLSPPSRPVEVFSVQGTTAIVPGRFAPGDEFFLALLDPADRVEVRIFNLEGIELQRLEAGAGGLYQIPWDGRDRGGSLLTSGPCLAVFEIEAGGRIRERLKKAFVFTRRGTEP